MMPATPLTAVAPHKPLAVNWLMLGIGLAGLKMAAMGGLPHVFPEPGSLEEKLWHQTSPGVAPAWVDELPAGYKWGLGVQSA